jgi:hypothetical protein
MTTRFVSLSLELNPVFDGSTAQILANLETKADLDKGQRYFEGSMKFMNTLTEVLDSLTDRVKVYEIYND